MPENYIGLMSGTSMDAVDAALVDFGDLRPRLIAVHRHPFPEDLRNRAAWALQEPVPLRVTGELDSELGELFAQSALKLLEDAQVSPHDVAGLGSHGQTIYHQPSGPHPFSWQLGDPNIIAERTGITTVADFRRRDIAAGGQGAPLVPAFHREMLGTSSHQRIVLNIGGIANITLLPADSTAPILGFDTGPGNTLLDAWIREHRAQAFDRDGAWAGSSVPNETLLKELLTDPYFALAPPKSTGFEHFNIAWLHQRLDQLKLSCEPVEVQATLTELSAVTIARAIASIAPTAYEVWTCGGGVHNVTLMERLRRLLPQAAVRSTSDAEIDPDWMEAMAFAWLARQTLRHAPGNVPSVTGATHEVVLGAVYSGRTR